MAVISTALPFLGLTLPGCSSGDPAALRPAPGPASPGTAELITCDWADVDAAVDIAMSRTESAILRSNAASEHYKVYTHDLVTITGRTGVLTIERTAPPERPAPLAADRLAAIGRPAEEVRITCRIGETGDETAERAMILAIRARLDDLKGPAAKRIKDEAFQIKD